MACKQLGVSQVGSKSPATDFDHCIDPTVPSFLYGYLCYHNCHSIGNLYRFAHRDLYHEIENLCCGHFYRNLDLCFSQILEHLCIDICNKYKNLKKYAGIVVVYINLLKRNYFCKSVDNVEQIIFKKGETETN